MDKETLETGLRIRAEVLGKEYVENSMKNADDFNRPFQEFVSEYCWGAGWGREGLSKKERSMLNLAMIAILNRPHELKLHVRGALTNGLTKEQIREIFIHMSIYAGHPGGRRCVPAGTRSVRRAGEEVISGGHPGRANRRAKRDGARAMHSRNIENVEMDPG